MLHMTIPSEVTRRIVLWSSKWQNINYHKYNRFCFCFVGTCFIVTTYYKEKYMENVTNNMSDINDYYNILITTLDTQKGILKLMADQFNNLTNFQQTTHQRDTVNGINERQKVMTSQMTTGKLLVIVKVRFIYAINLLILFYYFIDGNDHLQQDFALKDV